MFSLLTSNETRLYFIFTSNEVTYSTVFFRVKLNFSVTRINKYNAFLIQLSLASIHYLRSHFQEAIDIYKRILLDNRFVIYIFVLKEPRNCNLRIILVWSFFLFNTGKSSHVHRFVKSSFIIESGFWLLQNTKKGGW